MVTTNVATAKKKLSEFLNNAQSEEVVITANNKPKALLIGYQHFNELLDYIEDLEDELSIRRYTENPEPDLIPLSQVIENLPET